jgi:predicted nucleic acid-binding protein
VTSRIVLDASVAVKWFHEEEFTPEALSILEAADRDKIEIVVPSIFPYEVINALRKPRNLFNKDRLNGASEFIEERDLLGEEVNKGDLHTILELMFKHSVSPYDASYLLIAKKFRTRVITADKKLSDRIGLDSLALFIGSNELKNII